MTTKKKLTKKEIMQEAQKRIKKLLKARKYNGVLKCEVDVLSGASAMLGLFNELYFETSEENSMDLVPPMFFIAPMTNRSLMDD